MDTPVVAGGPVGYWSTLPVDELVAAVRAEGIAARGSLSAGSFVCNAVFYALRHHLRRRRGLRAGFVHVPGLPEQAGEGRPAMDMATQRRALGAMLRVLAD
jgi:pyroglutamyl-peptidase